jgi:Fe2+ or Zn2+ uptake regulation protein
MDSKSQLADKIVRGHEGWFRQAVVAADVRITGARAAVIGAMEKRLDCLNPEELAAECMAGRATVYRLFRILVDRGVLCHVLREDGVSYYHASPGRHGQHLLCISCGRLTELVPERLEPALMSALRGLGYRDLAFRVEASGVCPFCQSNAVDDRLIDGVQSLLRAQK